MRCTNPSSKHKKSSTTRTERSTSFETKKADGERRAKMIERVSGVASPLLAIGEADIEPRDEIDLPGRWYKRLLSLCGKEKIKLARTEQNIEILKLLALAMVEVTGGRAPREVTP